MRQYLLIICLFSSLAEASCLEDEKVLIREFVPTPFDKNRTTVGEDQVEPLKEKILSYFQNKDISFSQISLISSSSRAPYFANINGKRVIDPESNEKNLKLAKEREAFAMKVLSRSLPKTVSIDSKSSLNGPQFEPLDLNLRFVTNMSPNHKEKIESLYTQHKEMFEHASRSQQDLMNEKEYPSLYQAKFKPFQGFYVLLKGVKKCHPDTGKKDAPVSKQ